MDGNLNRGWMGTRTMDRWGEDRGCMDGSENRGWVGARTGDGWERR